MSETVTVVARIQAKPEKKAETRAALLALIEPTHREPGCIDYALHQSTEDPAVFVFYENWRSKQDLDEHLQMPYIQAMFARIDELLAGPPEIGMFSKIGG